MDFFYLLCRVHSSTNSMIDCIYNDGGRLKALKETNDTIKFGADNVRDCVTRAICIVTDRPYIEVWAALADINKTEGRRHSANTGVYTSRKGFQEYAHSIGLIYVPLDHMPALKDAPLPSGRIILNVYRHYTVMIDGVLHDTTHPSPSGKIRVKGYWMIKPAPAAIFNVRNTTSKAILNRGPLTIGQAETMARLLMLNYKIQTLIEPV